MILMGHIELIKARAEHARILAELGAKTFTQSYGNALDPQELKTYVSQAFSVDQISRELHNPKIHYRIACMDNVVCAYAKLVPSSLPACLKGANAIELMRLYVTPEYCRHGVGSRLMAMLIDCARTQGYEHMWLRVWQENHRAIDFYQKWRFHTVGSEPYHVGVCSETVLIMVRSLGTARKLITDSPSHLRAVLCLSSIAKSST